MIPVLHHPDGSSHPHPHPHAPRPGVIVAGSFNPLHAGHRALAAAAARRAVGPVHFELSTANVEKADLHHEEVLRRVAQFAGVAPVWVTRAAGFAAKADLFPGAAFAVGWDTAVRLLDPRYYAGDPAARDAALAHLLARGCRVLVGGRVDAAGVFRVWAGADAVLGFGGLFEAIPEAEFRLDVSATAIRRMRG